LHTVVIKIVRELEKEGIVMVDRRDNVYYVKEIKEIFDLYVI